MKPARAGRGMERDDMGALAFKKATKEKAKGKVALIGPSGSGKTWTALLLARALAQGGKVALIDSEHGTASKYADSFDFDHMVLETYEPENYIEGLRIARESGYAVVVVDSLSHAWAGKGGVLEFVDQEKRKSKTGNAYADGWGKATPKHNRLVEALLACDIHLIVTMRAKTEYVQEKDETTGKTRIRKIGMQPVQRDGLEYEFDVVADLDLDNQATISKSRCPKLNGAVLDKPDANLSKPLIEWLTAGVEPAKPAPKPVPVEQSKAPEPEGDYERVKPSQVAALWRLAKETWADSPSTAESKLREIVTRVAGVGTTKDIPADLYDLIEKEITGQPAQQEAE